MRFKSKITYLFSLFLSIAIVGFHAHAMEPETTWQRDLSEYCVYNNIYPTYTVVEKILVGNTYMFTVEASIESLGITASDKNENLLKATKESAKNLISNLGTKEVLLVITTIKAQGLAAKLKTQGCEIPHQIYLQDLLSIINSEPLLLLTTSNNIFVFLELKTEDISYFKKIMEESEEKGVSYSALLHKEVTTNKNFLLSFVYFVIRLWKKS